MRKFKFSILIFLLLLTPIMNIFEVKELMYGNLQNHNISLTPFYIKILKDFLIILILILFGIDLLILKKKVSISILLFIILLLVPVILSLYNNSILLIAYSLRGILPLSLIVSMKDEVGEQEQNYISKILFILFCLNFIIQIIQFMLPVRYFGTIMGLSLRNPGFYIIPSSCAAFNIIVYFYINNFGRIKNKLLINLLIVLSVFLTASGTGIIIILILIISDLIKIRKMFKIKLILLSMLSVLVFLFIPKLTGRTDIFLSILSRWDILLQNKYEIFSTNSGIFTNVAVLSGIQDSKILDSQYIWLLSNFGIIPFIWFMLLFFSQISLFKTKKYFEFLIIFLSFGITIIFLELFPLNIIFAINICYFFKIKKGQNENIISS